MHPRLAALIERLRTEGVEVRGLEELGAELEDKPWHRRLREFVSDQWEHALGEVAETREAFELLRRVEDLDEGEQATLRAQLTDLARMVPAATLTLAIEAIPVPGTSVLTPVVLVKLGLLPSRWREARIRARLSEEVDRLRAQGRDRDADELSALELQISLQRDACELLGRELQAHWDTEGDGWDAEDVQAYDAALDTTRAADPHAERFYVAYKGEVFGPIRLAELPEDVEVLVSYERTGFVRRSHLL